MSAGKNIPHDSAIGHVSGQSVYVDDRSLARNEVLVGYLCASFAHAKIISIDTSEALKVDGVLGIYTAKDLASNNWGTVVQDQPLLAKDLISYFDEPYAIIAATNEAAIQKARGKIKLVAQELPAVLKLQEAIDKKDFLYVPHPFVRGDAKSAIQKAPHKLKGEIEIGGQEHFYLENNVAVAYPLEDGMIEVHSSTQHPTETQHVVAKALGVDYHKVVCITKRLGGGFGGKESQAAPIAAMAAFVASRLRRPARMLLTKDEDMKITGKRHPFKNFYEVGFDQDGKILGIEYDLYADGGAYTDLSPSILERAMFHADGAYWLPDVSIKAACCKTNTYSNTAFRGFGGPQGLHTMESMIEDIANFLGKDAYDIRQLNCYSGKNNVTPYGQVLEENPLPEIFSTLRKSSDYDKRKKEIQSFNAQDKFKVRGLSMTATKFGIAFTARFLNQGNALVNLHADGSLQVSTGAVEMGQGVNTKIKQLVASTMGVSASKVSVMSTSTEKNANTSPTAASSGADINGAAAVKATAAIRNRVAQVAIRYFEGEKFDNLSEYEITTPKPMTNDETSEPAAMPAELARIKFAEDQVSDSVTGKSAKLYEIVKVAHLNRVGLSEYAHYKTEGIGFDKQKVFGKPFRYFTNGAAVSEVEIDRFTGECKVLRVDILMDLGRMINPGIDRGQTTGAFIQGMGWVLTEKLYHNAKGALVSHSPTTYKIPNVQDTPRIFNVDFIENNKNEGTVFKSKAVGEPPFLLGSSCWTACKNALASLALTKASTPSAQTQTITSLKKLPKINSPATGEELLTEITRLESESGR